MAGGFHKEGCFFWPFSYCKSWLLPQFTRGSVPAVSGTGIFFGLSPTVSKSRSLPQFVGSMPAVSGTGRIPNREPVPVADRSILGNGHSGTRTLLFSVAVSARGGCTDKIHSASLADDLSS